MPLLKIYMNILKKQMPSITMTKYREITKLAIKNLSR